MDRVARLPITERSALFAETAAKMNTTTPVAEKDFWVTWVLDRLFADTELARLLMRVLRPETVNHSAGLVSVLVAA